ncbi:MAG TPA: GntR family transcriptional regulator [Egibacteraceae bacterium]|nr:GntR family transcriptional regulator [Egibacteraceae bacterium]
MLEASTGEGPTSSMVDDVYDALLKAIAEAQLAAGTPLSQNKLAARMGVSRTPVREALLRLERDGLVQRLPDTGFVVASITPEEANEACDLLAVLDTYVYTRAARALTKDQIDDLLVLATSLVQSAEAGDAEAWRNADRRYHAMVMSAAANRFVAEYLEQTRRRVQRFWMSTPDFGGRLRICSQDHVALAQAMADRDETVLTETVRGHIERLRASVLARLESARPLLPGPDPLSAMRPLRAPAAAPDGY